MTVFFSRVLILLTFIAISASQTSAAASSTGDKVTCGGHWFFVEAQSNVSNEVVITIGGDFVHGRELKYSAISEAKALDDGSVQVVYVFNRISETKFESLVTTFFNHSDFGSGVYTGLNGRETAMSCSR